MGKRLYALQKKKRRSSQKHNGPFTRTANPDIGTSFQPHICWILYYQTRKMKDPSEEISLTIYLPYDMSCSSRCTI